MKKRVYNNFLNGTCLVGGCFIAGFSIGTGMGIGFTMVMCYMNSTGIGLYSFLTGVSSQLYKLSPLKY